MNLVVITNAELWVKALPNITFLMEAREVEELIAGQYIVRYTSVLTNRFDSTAFKKVMPEIYKAYTKQVSSRRFTISV